MPKLITIEGYWKDDPESHIRATCQIGLDITENDDYIFYYFDDNEPILGDHGEFIVTNYEV